MYLKFPAQVYPQTHALHINIDQSIKITGIIIRKWVVTCCYRLPLPHRPLSLATPPLRGPLIFLNPFPVRSEALTTHNNNK